MNKIVKKDILKIIDDGLILIGQKNFVDLKKISNHTIHNASIFQDRDSISIAIIIYAMSKIMERTGSIDAEIVKKLKDAYDLLIKDKTKEYQDAIKNILELISKVDVKLKQYIDEVIKQAEVKKGSKLYEHGLSIAQASELLGISQWELMSYIGKTSITEEGKITDIKKRLELARNIFGA
ncbi:MAG: hypothetical protein Q7J54_04050 [Candidatus Woesearchaeota archaeon]|nr:hypothetical protein [Candidatus Woesearchaeota archaeon]